MPLFDWVGAFQVGWNLGQYVFGEMQRFDEDVEGEHFGVQLSKTEVELAALGAKRWDRAREEGRKLERTRWLEEHHAERSFACGIVPDPVLAATQPKPPDAKPVSQGLPSEPGWAAPETPVTQATPPDPQPLTPLRPMQVIAAVLPKDLVFIREQGTDEDVEEVGRLSRSAIQDTDVVDANGAHVPQPVREEIDEPQQLVFVSLRWTNEGTPDEDRFAFRSPWQAWQAAHRLLEAKVA